MSKIYILAFSLFSVCIVSGCGRPTANDPVADSEVATKLRASLVSASTTSASAETQTAAKATGWATIKGRFVYDGTPSTPPRLNIDKDQEVCGKHNLVNESIVVGSDNGLANVALYARNRNLEIHPDYEASATKEALLDNNGCRFEPHVLAVRAGQPLTIKNSDPVGHNTNAALVGNSPFNVIISGGTQSQQKLAKAENAPVTVTCNIHPWMKGYLVVQPHPYVAITGKDGSFEIKNAPAGVPLEFQVWHEASTGTNGAVAANRPDLKWQPSGRFTVTLDPDQVLDLKDIKIPASALAVK